MPLINKHFITDKLIPAISIDRFIAQYAKLKKQGSNYVCCCPFHQEKTPSFNISPAKGMYYCFGCKASGNVVSFLMKYKNLPFTDAIEQLAQFAGLSVEYDGVSEFKEDHTRAYELADKISEFFTKALFENKQALDYFVNKRGLSEDLIVKQRLGYAPNSFNYISEHFTANKDDLKLLEKLGLLISKGPNSSYAFFRNRVIIPIKDIKGRIISFGGRTLGDDKPKYLNTQESMIFHKRKELFGLYQALLANNNRPKRLIIVEGYLDVLSLIEHGVNNAVASLGTATSVEQIQLMFRYTDEVVCCYDGDFAGRHAAQRVLELMLDKLEGRYNLRFAFLPPEHDPDSMIRALGADSFDELIEKAISIPEFLVDYKKQSYNLDILGQKNQFINDIIKDIKNINLNSMQTLCIEHLAKSLSLPSSRLYQILDSLDQKDNKANEVKVQDIIVNNSSNSPVRRLIAFIIQQPNVVTSVYESLNLDQYIQLLKDLKLKEIGYIDFYLNVLRTSEQISSAIFLEKFRDTNEFNIISKLLALDFIPKKIDGSELGLQSRVEFFIGILKDVVFYALSQAKQRCISSNLSEEQKLEMICQFDKILNIRFTK